MIDEKILLERRDASDDERWNVLADEHDEHRWDALAEDRDAWDVVMADIRLAISSTPHKGRPPEEVLEAYEDIIPGCRMLLEQGVEDEKSHRKMMWALLGETRKRHRKERLIYRAALTGLTTLLLIVFFLR